MIKKKRERLGLLSLGGRLGLVGDDGGHRRRRSGRLEAGSAATRWSTTRCMRSMRVLSSGMSFGELRRQHEDLRGLAVGRDATELDRGRPSGPCAATSPATAAPAVGRVEWRRDGPATTWIRVWLDGPVSGSARAAAWLLGALAGRKALLLLFTWLPRLGSAFMAAPVPTSHTTTTTQR